jgi:hypothetical protein
MNLSRTEIKQASSGFFFFSILFVWSIFAATPLAWHGHRLLPTTIMNWLFFWPQCALIPYGLTHKGNASDPYLWTAGMPIAITLWVIIAAYYGWYTRKLSMLYKVLLCYPMMFVINFLIFLYLGIIGFSPYLEGP